jgi:hypothetical protein
MAIVSGKVVVKDLILIGSFSKATAAVRDIYMSEALDVINAASAMYQHDPNLNGGLAKMIFPFMGLIVFGFRSPRLPCRLVFLTF